MGMQSNASFKDKQMNEKKSDPGGLAFWRLVSEVTEMWWAKRHCRKEGNRKQPTGHLKAEVGSWEGQVDVHCGKMDKEEQVKGEERKGLSFKRWLSSQRS